MELHGENEYKIKSYNNAIFNLERFHQPLEEMEVAALEKINGVGKTLAAAIDEINRTGSIGHLNELIAATPKGLRNLIGLKGLGAKKLHTLWKSLNIESEEALLAAIDSNKLAGLKGFGAKTQENIKEVLAFRAQNKGKLHYATAEKIAREILEGLQVQVPKVSIALTGALRRKLEIIDVIQLLATDEYKTETLQYLEKHDEIRSDTKRSGPFAWRGHWRPTDTLLEVRFCPTPQLAKQQLISTGSGAHLSHRGNRPSLFWIAKNKEFSTEQEAYEMAGLPFIEPELREGVIEFGSNVKTDEELIEMQDLKGILHCHSTYSDGKHSLEEMAQYCRELGYEYLGITDHSKSSYYYANGLYEERVHQQHEEIDRLNQAMAPFKIFKGIEADILTDGNLDYDQATLASFDFIIASVHSALTMDIRKSTERLLKAIANPYTTIMGHLTGRLLLEREGYPVDHKTIIDACAAHQVAIEINAHPFRLDLDWRWVPYALEKGVMLSINPDAHEKNGYYDMYYGICAGRKGGLTQAGNLNSMSRQEIEQYFVQRKEKALAQV